MRRRDDHALVPIGHLYPGLSHAVVDSSCRRTSGVGELCVGGPQRFSGYLDDLDETSTRTIYLDDDNETSYYRTGDLVSQGPDGYEFRGRVDREIKLFGHRVHLDAVEEGVRACPDVIDAAAIAVTGSAGLCEGIECFVVTLCDDPVLIMSQIRQQLPASMIPSVHVIAQLPRNANGKTDYAQLQRRVEVGSE